MIRPSSASLKARPKARRATGRSCNEEASHCPALTLVVVRCAATQAASFARLASSTSVRNSVLALEPADMLLGVEFKPDPPDQIKLGFEEIDVMLLVLHQAFEQIARDVVLDAVAIGRGFLVKRAGGNFGSKIALDDFLDVLPDPQGVEHLHVGKPAEEQEAIGEAVGVVHLLDGLLPP